MTRMTLEEFHKLISKIESQYGLVFRDLQINREGTTLTYTDAQSLSEEAVCDPRIEEFDFTFKRDNDAESGWVHVRFARLFGDSVWAHGSDESWVKGITPAIANELRLYRVWYGFLRSGGLTRGILGVTTGFYIYFTSRRILFTITDEDVASLGIMPEVLAVVALLAVYGIPLCAGVLIWKIGDVRSRIVRTDSRWGRLARQEMWAMLATGAALATLALSVMDMLNT